jgi:hypothetical protein
LSLRSDFDDDEWVGFCCLFFVFWQSVARADGSVDAQEEQARDELIRGGHELLSRSVHDALGSSLDLAQEVLAFGEDDRRLFLTTVATVPESELPSIALRTDAALKRWTAETSTANERLYRQACAKGLRMEAFHFALRVGRSSGDERSERRISRDEAEIIGRLRPIAGISAADAEAIVTATGGAR